MRARRTMAMATLAVVLTIAGCSSDGSDGADAPSTDDTATADDGTTAADAATPDEGDTGSGGSGEPGSLTLDGEDIELGAGRCLLEEQPSAGGGGTIEATAQAEGTDADGDQVVVDFTRYSADSAFAGDDVSITIGDPFSGEAVNLTGSSDAGTVQIDGTTVSASQFEVSEDLADTVFVDFTIAC